MTVFQGAERIGAAAPAEAPAKASKGGGRPTKAELIAQAEALGIEVPEGATNPEIRALVDAAKAEAGA